MDKLNVVYHSSDLFSPVLGTSIVSLFENNKVFNDIEVFVFENKISEKNKNRLNSLADKYHRKLVFIPMPDINKVENLGMKSIKDNWMFDSYCRMFLDNYLPEDINRVLYLDSDVLVVDSLVELWETDLGTCPAAVVRNCVSESYFKLFGMNDSSIYCNSGVILIDINRWREMNIDQRVRDYVKANNGYVFFMEQTTLSVVLQDELVSLHPRYNALSEITNMNYKEMCIFRKPKRYYDEKIFNEAKNDPAIIHMTNSFLVINRAWYEVTNHPAKDIYRYYYSLTGWANEPLFRDNRSKMKKTLQKIMQYIPRFVLLPMVSFVYNYVRVWNIQRVMKKNRG